MQTISSLVAISRKSHKYGFVFLMGFTMRSLVLQQFPGVEMPTMGYDAVKHVEQLIERDASFWSNTTVKRSLLRITDDERKAKKTENIARQRPRTVSAVGKKQSLFRENRTIFFLETSDSISAVCPGECSGRISRL